MRALKALVRGLSFTGKFLISALLMLLIGVAQAPAVLWYVTAATPACDAALSSGQTLTAQLGLGALGVASATLATLLAVFFLRLRWGWFVWWIVVVAALAAPSAALYLLPTLSPGTGGLFCH